MYAGRPPPQPGPLVEELRPCERDEEHGNLADPRRQHLEQVEQALVGPVDVLVQEQCRPAQRQRLDEDARREEERLAVDRLARTREPEQDSELRRVLLRRGGAGELRDSGVEPITRGGRFVAVEDAGNLLDLLGEGAVRLARPVGRRASANHPTALVRDELGQLEAESGLPDPGRAEHRHEMRTALARDALPCLGEDAELALAADHRHGRRRALADGRRRAQCDPRAHRRALPLCEHGLGGAVLDRRSGC